MRQVIFYCAIVALVAALNVEAMPQRTTQLLAANPTKPSSRQLTTSKPSHLTNKNDGHSKSYYDTKPRTEDHEEGFYNQENPSGVLPYEETSAPEVKPEEIKPEEAKPEDLKTEETKSEESKAEEPKSESTVVGPKYEPKLSKEEPKPYKQEPKPSGVLPYEEHSHEEPNKKKPAHSYDYYYHKKPKDDDEFGVLPFEETSELEKPKYKEESKYDEPKKQPYYYTPNSPGNEEEDETTVVITAADRDYCHSLVARASYNTLAECVLGEHLGTEIPKK
ncbi:hypothetical protein BDF22DRAFT_687106 [Syncephalis plumigaleata]|nr:hypothetical protein BDF22DRAFT_687106 [Syncephalis plumigaleata]